MQYGNVPDEVFTQLPTWSAPDGYANGKGLTRSDERCMMIQLIVMAGPFREVQLLIDGTLAGVIFPYRKYTYASQYRAADFKLVSRDIFRRISTLPMAVGGLS